MNSCDFDVFAQPDDFALAVRNLNADSRLARHALDQNAFRFQGEAEVVRQVGNPAVLDARFRLELERSDHRARIDLRDLAMHIELGVLRDENLRQHFQFLGIDRLLLVGAVQQAAGRKFETPGDARQGRLGFWSAIRAFGDLRDSGSACGFGCCFERGLGVGWAHSSDHALNPSPRSVPGIQALQTGRAERRCQPAPAPVAQSPQAWRPGVFRVPFASSACSFGLPVL